jgi:serine/threonine-protein kinase
VIHRDLKPANIVLSRTRDGSLVPKILDFGISKLLDRDSTAAEWPSLTATSTVLGTPGYMAPEQISSTRSADERTDQYALGVVLYECATGKVPFEATTLFELMGKIVEGIYDAPRTIRPDLPAEFEAVIVRAMSRVPGDRFPNMRALGMALAPFATAEQQALYRRVFFDPIDAPVSVESPIANTGEVDVTSATVAAPSRDEMAETPSETTSAPERDIPTLLASHAGSSLPAVSHAIAPKRSSRRGKTAWFSAAAIALASAFGVTSMRATRRPNTAPHSRPRAPFAEQPTVPRTASMTRTIAPPAATVAAPPTPTASAHPSLSPERAVPRVVQRGPPSHERRHSNGTQRTTVAQSTRTRGGNGATPPTNGGGDYTPD